IKRAEGGIDYGVMPLEGLWWVPDMSTFTTADKSAWDWTMMIMQPDQVTPDLLEQARVKAAAKNPLEAISRVRLERFGEGTAAQVMHTGPYATEGPTIQRLHAFIDEQGYERTGKHHEIYLSDPRRAAPEKLKTIVRQPVTAR
ncbi:MAG: GyrI-like domain-containing protein, partial [Aeromicrobium sp.]